MYAKSNVRRRLPWFICLIIMPIVVILGVTLFSIKRYAILSMIAAILAILPFFLKYEKRKPQAREILLVAIMCALAITSRLLFAFTPAFKPVTAIVIITGMMFGKEAGFLSGAMSALLSNIFFGQGPWTPFQMLSWGLIGFVAGILNRKHRLEHAIPLYIFGAFSGICYSMLMDVWSVISIDGYFNLTRYLILLTTSLPFMVMYMISNVIFLALIWKVMIRKLKRIQLKYGLLEIEGE